MASLKHLLNLDDDSDVYSVHPPSLVWDDSGFFDEYAHIKIGNQS
jgi:hypothetical protein